MTTNDNMPLTAEQTESIRSFKVNLRRWLNNQMREPDYIAHLARRDYASILMDRRCLMMGSYLVLRPESDTEQRFFLNDEVRSILQREMNCPSLVWRSKILVSTWMNQIDTMKTRFFQTRNADLVRRDGRRVAVDLADSWRYIIPSINIFPSIGNVTDESVLRDLGQTDGVHSMSTYVFEGF